jgi:hypothetical protein
VTFHELAPRLTRIEVNMDVDPGSLIEKAARGMRRVKRAVRADLHRFSLTSRCSQLAVPWMIADCFHQNQTGSRGLC